VVVPVELPLYSMVKLASHVPEIVKELELLMRVLVVGVVMIGVCGREESKFQDNEVTADEIEAPLIWTML
jgi:hypothetical protein